MTKLPFYEFIKLLNEEKNKKIWVYSEAESYWPFYKPLINNLTKNNIEVIYVTSDKHELKIKNSSNKIKKYYIGNGIVRILFFIFLNCKNIIMTMPDLDNFYIKKSKNKVKYIYLFHSLNSSHMAYTEKSFDNYDIIFSPTKYIKKEIEDREKNFFLNKKIIYEVGYHRLDNLININNNKYIKNYIVIAPTRHNENLIKNGADLLISILLKNKFKVELRAHHENKNKKEYKKILKKFCTKENFFIRNTYSGEKNIIEPEFLISDWSGVAIEFSFATERPSIFINTPKKIENSNYKKLKNIPFEIENRNKIGISLSLDRIEDIIEVIENLRIKKNDYKRNIKSIKDNSVYNLNNSSDVGVNIIRKLIND